jgi:hypothetical protein
LNNELTPDGKKYSSLFDGLGSIVAMTDGSGNEVNSYDYDPYGQNINQVEQTGLNNPWKFAGGYLDSSTTLYTFGTRLTIHRWAGGRSRTRWVAAWAISIRPTGIPMPTMIRLIWWIQVGNFHALLAGLYGSQ